jgi:hypothetical protein
MRESGSAEDLRALRNLRESLSARLDGGDSGARRIVQVVDEMIAEREAALAHEPARTKNGAYGSRDSSAARAG